MVPGESHGCGSFIRDRRALRASLKDRTLSIGIWKDEKITEHGRIAMWWGEHSLFKCFEKFAIIRDEPH